MRPSWASGPILSTVGVWPLELLPRARSAQCDILAAVLGIIPFGLGSALPREVG